MARTTMLLPAPPGGLIHKLMLVILLCVWGTWVVAASTERAGTLFFKVSSLLPTSMSNCLITSVVLPSVAPCLEACAKLDTCHLVCHKGTDCQMYKALVSKGWDASGSAIPMTEQVDFSCYTSWNYPNDITHHIVSSSSLNVHTLDHTPNFSHDGYFCEMYNNYYYHSQTEASNWYQMDLGKAFKVSKVVVKARNAAPNGVHFASVEVRVGNVSGSGDGDFSANPRLGFYAGPAGSGETVTIGLTRPLYGRYVSLKRVGAMGHMMMGEIKVLS